MPFVFRRPTGMGDKPPPPPPQQQQQAAPPPPAASPPPPPTSGSGPPRSSPPASKLTTGTPVSGTRTSTTHTSSGMVEEMGSVLDSAMDSEKSQVKEPRPHRAAAFALIAIVLFGGLTYMVVEWYKKKELRMEAMDVPR